MTAAVSSQPAIQTVKLLLEAAPEAFPNAKGADRVMRALFEFLTHTGCDSIGPLFDQLRAQEVLQDAVWLVVKLLCKKSKSRDLATAAGLQEALVWAVARRRLYSPSLAAAAADALLSCRNETLSTAIRVHSSHSKITPPV